MLVAILKPREEIKNLHQSAEYNIYQQAVEKQSDKAENLGLKLLNNKSYRSFYKLHPEEKAQILYQMGNLYLEKEQYEKASS